MHIRFFVKLIVLKCSTGFQESTLNTYKQLEFDMTKIIMVMKIVVNSIIDLNAPPHMSYSDVSINVFNNYI